jgi:hypothetical protein
LAFIFFALQMLIILSAVFKTALAVIHSQDVSECV